MRKLLVVLTGLAVVCLLSACAFPVFRNDDQNADAQMAKIADAINDGDSDALTALFTPRAVEQAPDLDGGADYLLSLFPDGGVTWERTSLGAAGTTQAGEEAYLIGANYKLTANGKEYWLFLADFTVNHDADNVGLFALGVDNWTDDIRSEEAKPFFDWVTSIQYNRMGEAGYPGIYVPADGDGLS